MLRTQAFIRVSIVVLLFCLLVGCRVPDRVIEIQVDPGDYQGQDAWPLGVGVPLPQGEVRSTDVLHLKGRRQGYLPIQVTTKTRWPDGSIKWVWLDFQGKPSDRYQLEIGSHQQFMSKGAPEVIVKEQQEKDSIFVETGSMYIAWDRKYASPKEITIAEGPSTFIPGDGEGIYVIDNEGQKGILGGDGAELFWSVEMDGPIRAVLRVEGRYVTSQGDPLARAIVRYYLYAGRTFFTMDHTLIFTRDMKGTNRVWFREVGLHFPWQGNQSSQARFGVDKWDDLTGTTMPVELAIGDSEEQAWIFQDDYPHFAQTRMHFSVGTKVKGTQKEGQVAAGWCDAADGVSKTVVAVRDFAPQFPKELQANRQGVTALLWSNRGGKELDYRSSTLLRDYYGEDWIRTIPEPESDKKSGVVHGEKVGATFEDFKEPNTLNPSWLGSARTHQVFCGYQAGIPDPDVSSRWAATFDRPPAVLSNPEWLCNSGAFWPIAPDLENRGGIFQEAEEFIPEYFDHWLGRMSRFPMNGWIGFGVGPDSSYKEHDGKVYAEFYRLNNVAAYNTPKNVWTAYLRTGDRKYLDFVEPNTRFLADFKIIHWEGQACEGIDPKEEKRKTVDKEKGLLTVHAYGALPFYWGGMGRLSTGQSTDYIAPFRIAYLLCDSRWALDALELYAEAVNRDWDPDEAEKLVKISAGPFALLSMMINTYHVTQDDDLADRIHSLAEQLIDLNTPHGLRNLRELWGDTFEIPTYKIDRKIMALLDYYDLFHVNGASQDDLDRAEKVKEAVLKANEHMFALSCWRPALGYQNAAPIYLMRCSQWTGNTDYYAAAVSHLESALDWFREFKALPKDSPKMGGYLRRFEQDVQGFPFFTVPHILHVMARPPHAEYVFPYHANLGRDTECPIHFQKTGGGDIKLLIHVFVGLREQQEIKLIIKDSHGNDVTQVSITETDVDSGGTQKLGGKLYHVTIPDATSEPYCISLDPPHRFKVIGCNADKLVFSMPEGTYLGHRDNIGYGSTRGKRYYFQVLSGQSFTIKASRRSIQIFDPDGIKRAEVPEDMAGPPYILNVDTGNQFGYWSLLPGPACYVRFEDGDLKPVVAFGEPTRFLELPNIGLAQPEEKLTPPTETGLVESGCFGGGLHVTGSNPYWFKADLTAAVTGFPFDQGTVECFIRTDFHSRWYPERSQMPFWILEPFGLCYQNRPEHDSSSMFMTWLHFYPAYSTSKSGEFKTRWNEFETLWTLEAGAYAPFDANNWYHIACTWMWNGQNSEFVLYRDGVNIAKLLGKVPRDPVDIFLYFGPLKATFDEFRVSDKVRYTGDSYTLPDRAFAWDDNTKLLFHFDCNLVDESGVELIEQ